MTERMVYTPIVLGKDAATSEEVAWAWYDEMHSSMTIVGSSINGTREVLVDQIIKELQRQDTEVVYRITASGSVTGVSIDSDAILWSDKLPDPPEEYEDRDTFINTRRWFSTSYFNLFAFFKRIPRSDLLPPTSYRWNIEGPLSGYQRAIENLEEDHYYKVELQRELEKLSVVPWYKSKDKGTVYHLDKTEDPALLALSFLRSVWSFWSLIGKQDHPQQIVLIVDVPDKLLDVTLDPIVAEIVSFSYDILKYLTIETTVTLLLSSDRMYPAPEKEFRHKIVFAGSKDFDLNSEDIKHAINPLLFEKWSRGEQSTGIHFDDFVGSQTVLDPKISNSGA